MERTEDRRELPVYAVRLRELRRARGMSSRRVSEYCGRILRKRHEGTEGHGPDYAGGFLRRERGLHPGLGAGIKNFLSGYLSLPNRENLVK